MSKAITQAEIARRWGVNRSRITQYKTEGMPVNSMDAAFNWLSIHYPDRAVKIMDAQDATHAAAETKSGPLEPPPEPAAQPEVKPKGLAVVVARLVKSENVAWAMLDHAIKQNQVAKVQSLSKHYNAAAAARISAEKDLADYQVKVRELMPVSEAMELIGKILAPVKSQLTALPYSTAARANPSDPELAREAISAEVVKMTEGITKALEGLK